MEAARRICFKKTLKALNCKNKKGFALAVILFLSFNFLAEAQTEVKNYEIKLAGFSIGDMVATKTTKENRDEYLVKSIVSFWFFGTLKIEFELLSVYEDGQFIYSESNSKARGEEFYSEVRWDGEKYIVNANSYKFSNQDTIYEPIYFSTALLFFEEPKGDELFLSENYGVTSPFRRLKNGGLEANIKGHDNKYFFEDGFLLEANMHSTLKNYWIKRKEPEE
ncbi:DUF6134 family protein [Algoriphagus sediminis]|uniref:DUF2490 domain-containing protein n=1 Tax=Algoriphagus sediminis TaxID=3057113 RepID=A0ABT7YD87_9BACT|nr:DUF6134 family protein [Algoriphagus sediminis]MDN3204498.1 hypothetical protein [Algoriphagus sediminis]